MFSTNNEHTRACKMTKAMKERETSKRRLTGMALVGIRVIAVLSAAPAYADGLVTMHGSACKPNREPHDNYFSGTEGLRNMAGQAIGIVCPLTNHWGGGTDRPCGIGTRPNLGGPISMYFGSYSPISCTLNRQNVWGGIEEQTTVKVDHTDWWKVLTFPAIGAGDRVNDHDNQYVIHCSLPVSSFLYSVQYRTHAAFSVEGTELACARP